MLISAARRIALIAGLALCLPGCGAVTASLHDPQALPALEQESRVHYEPSAKSYAEAVAAVLPRAIAKIEAVQGAPFSAPFTVVAYADAHAYAAANGRGDARAAGVTFYDRISLSPGIWREKPELLEAYLTHELCHEHWYGYISALAYWRIPDWFHEGLAVMASDGAGAQLVSLDEASRAIAAGETIETPDEPSLIRSAGIKFRRSGAGGRWPGHMAYRQAGMFVTYLRKKNSAAFASFLQRLRAGERFKPAFETSFGASVAENWANFAGAISRS